MSIDLSQFSPDQLDALINEAAEQKRRRLRERVGEVRRKLTDMARAEGYTIEDLFGTSRGGSSGSRKKVEPKYRDPANPERTWSGRGKRPRWLAAEIDSGKSLESFQIKS